MVSVRLKTNIISGGKLYQRGTVVEESLVAPHLRDAAHVDYDLENREGRVLVLRDLAFSSIPRPDSEGVPTSYPVQVTAGELLDLSTVPQAMKELIKEGVDFKTDWTHEEADALQKAAQEAYLKQFTAEPEIPIGRSR